MVTILKGTMLTGIGTKQKLLITALASPLGRRAGLKRKVPGLLLRVWVEIWAAFYFLIGNFPLRIKKSNQLVTESGMVAALGKLFLIMLSKSQGQEFSGAIIELCTTSAGEAEGAIDQYFPFVEAKSKWCRCMKKIDLGMNRRFLPQISLLQSPVNRIRRLSHLPLEQLIR